MDIKLKNRGFTLIELLTVIMIIGILSSLAMFAFSTAREKAKEAAVLHDLDVIGSAMRTLVHDTALWPGGQPAETVCTLACGLNELCTGATCAMSLASSSAGITGTDGSYPNWDGPYMNRIPPDPWGREYFFDTDYSVNAGEEPCDCGGPCHNVAAIGAFSPESSGNGDYNCEEIIRILAR